MTNSDYDSTDDTIEHIAQVNVHMAAIVVDLKRRMGEHDRSKLEDPEKAVFDEFTPKLSGSTYGSDEYMAFLDGMGPGLRHHYEHNDHHPEHYPNGVADMNLMQVVEMLCDWKAATLRHADGDLLRSIEQNAERFGYGDEIKRLLINTAVALEWIPAGYKR